MKTRYIRVLKRIAQEAGHALLLRDRQGDIAAYSGEQTTHADVFSETIIQERLAVEFPKARFFGEESGGDRESPVVFIVDPIDGTGNYLMGDPFWGVSIAEVRNGQTTAGVVVLPELSQTFSAIRGVEMSLGGHISHTGRLKGAHVWFDQDWTRMSAGGVHILECLIRAGALPQIRRCCTASMMWVATGKISAFIHTQPKPFDIAAAGLIVEMSGGRVTDLDGRPWHPFSSSIVASNGAVHDELLELLSAS